MACRTHFLAGVGLVVAMTAAMAPAPLRAADRPLAASGKTQIVAKLDSREITIADLRSEMARLGLAPGDPQSEPAALQSIIARALLANAARERKLHRQPEALRQIATAQEQALADMYLASAAQPPEPTREEIEDFVRAQPELFSQRRIYTFSVLTLPTAVFDARDLTPLFDDSADFAELSLALDRDGVDYAVTPAVQPSDAFPEPIRKQLGEYARNDNIVVRGGEQAQIMKITAIKDAPIASADAFAIARRAIMAEAAQTRAGAIMGSLKQGASLSYYRRSAAPAAAAPAQ